MTEYDDDFEPTEEEPSKKILDEKADTLKKFLKNISSTIEDIQQSTFDYYTKFYSNYYEKPFEVLFENKKIRKTESGQLHEPLGIKTKEQHFEYMTILEGTMILGNNTIIIPFSYDIDGEHGLEIKIRDNKVIDIGGIVDTIHEY